MSEKRTDTGKRAKSQYINRYVSDNYERIATILHKGDGDIIRADAASRGVSVSEYIKNAVRTVYGVDIK